ncbi:hypothetical protein BS78_06G214400 [Paspalum vaginatum]|nr:hypothetical protein BS78_06G214400 [Paspalum vaginatum]
MSSSYSRRRQECDDESAAKKRPRRAQKHLYLVVNDWEMGFSIHKLDVNDLEPYDAAGAPGRDKLVEVGRLPAEPCVRIETSDVSPPVLASLGSKIFLVTDRFCDDEAPILIYDAETASLAVGPRPTPALRPLGFMFILPVGRRLYAFNPRRGDLQCSFEVISRAPVPREDEDEQSRRNERWSVEGVPVPMPLLKDERVTAYALHPDGRTIFVSARNWSRLDRERKGGTHSFDTRSSVWTWHGEWMLPFHGQGYFVDELDAWVGLRRDGFLCSCDVPSRRGTAELPDWKLAGEKTLFREDPERHYTNHQLARSHTWATAGCALLNARSAKDTESTNSSTVRSTPVCSMSPYSASSMTKGATYKLRLTKHDRTLSLGTVAANTFSV